MSGASQRPPWPCLRADRSNSGWTPALGPAQGKLRWSYTIEHSYLADAPVVDAKGTAYIGTGSGICALAADGQLGWRLPTDTAARTPCLDERGDLVSAVHRAGLLFCKADGRDRRDVAHRLNSPSSPAIAEDGRIFVGTRPQLYAFAADGAQLWATDCQGDQGYPPALATDGRIFVKAQDQFTPDPDEFTECQDIFLTLLANGEIKASEHVSGYSIDGDCWGTNLCGGDGPPLCDQDGTPVVGLGKQVWIGPRKVALAGSGPLALAPTAVIYAGTKEGLVALNRDGSRRWMLNTGGAVSQPVVDGEGRVYCARHDGTIYAANREGRPLWSWDMPAADRERSAGMAISYGLAIGAGHTLYVAAYDTLYALGE